MGRVWRFEVEQNDDAAIWLLNAIAKLAMTKALTLYDWRPTPHPQSSIAPENSPKLLKWLEDNVPLIGGQAFCFPPPNESGGKVVGLIEVRLILKKYYKQARTMNEVFTPNSMEICFSPIIVTVLGWLEEPETPY